MKGTRKPMVNSGLIYGGAKPERVREAEESLATTEYAGFPRLREPYVSGYVARLKGEEANPPMQYRGVWLDGYLDAMNAERRKAAQTTT